MAVKIIHTADWHLGHHLHGFDREHEHQLFLDWLMDLLKKEQADALLVAGDLFDTANPSASAWQMLYQFLAKLFKEMPKLKIILLGGNHDSPSKLNAPHSLLKAFDLHMLGSVQRDDEAKLDHSSLLVPINNKNNETEAWVQAVPFLRLADLRTQHLSESQDKFVDAVRELYQEVYQAAKQKQQKNQALIAMGHLYMASSTSSLDSERAIVGNQHALPADMFNPDIDYVALGHLHLAQKVGKKEHIRYSGSPIPLSFAERNYQHQVLTVSFDKGKLVSILPHLVPRAVDIIRIPEKPKPLEQVIEMLRRWQVDACELAYQPLVEVQVLVNEPQPHLRDKILQAIEDKAIRLAKISLTYQGEKAKQVFSNKALNEVTPLQVLEFGWQQKYTQLLPENIKTAFDTLQQTAELEKGDKA